MNKLYNAISGTLEIAAILLFIGWVFSFVDISGWWWVSCALGSTFFDRLS